MIGSGTCFRSPDKAMQHLYPIWMRIGLIETKVAKIYIFTFPAFHPIYHVGTFLLGFQRSQFLNHHEQFWTTWPFLSDPFIMSFLLSIPFIS